VAWVSFRVSAGRCVHRFAFIMRAESYIAITIHWQLVKTAFDACTAYEYFVAVCMLNPSVSRGVVGTGAVFSLHTARQNDFRTQTKVVGCALFRDLSFFAGSRKRSIYSL